MSAGQFVARHVVAWLRSAALGLLVGAAAGCASALFLHLLDAATAFRVAHEAVVYALPLAGLGMGHAYDVFAGPVRRGNDLVLDAIHDPTHELPLRMAPMVLVGTVLTHLFGGSAGREGTAVQMGASLAAFVGRTLRADRDTTRVLLVAGASGGFGAVFGTPLAGAIFGLEFVTRGRIERRATTCALVASFFGDFVTRSLGVVHTAYPTAPFVALSIGLALKWLAFAAALALTAFVFIELTHRLKRLAERRIARQSVRMLLGGALVVIAWRLLGSSDYLGLGVPGILRAFSDPALPAGAFALKLLFTSITLGFGFVGGEVTPLFFVGASLGNLLGRGLGIPLPLAAGIGLAALFGTAAKAPIALAVMAVELFGREVFPHVVFVSVFAYLLVGARSIYRAQRAA